MSARKKGAPEAPTPEEPYWYLPGSFFASATNSQS